MRNTCKYINLKEIQDYYNNNHTWDDIISKYSATEYFIAKNVKNGNLKSRSKKEAMDTNTRNKISSSLKKAHKENRHLGWLNVNLNKEKRTYAEAYFLNILNKDNFFSKYRIFEKVGISRYVLDFAIPELTLDIEIDGQFHFTDKKTIQKDIVRNYFLRNLGWNIFRISWQEFKKNNQLIIEELKKFILSLDIINNTLFPNEVKIIQGLYRVSKYSFNNIKIKKFNNKKEYLNYKSNTYIPNFKARKVIRPSYENLIKDLNEMSCVKVGKKYNVSNTMIKKWIKYYKREKNINI